MKLFQNISFIVIFTILLMLSIYDINENMIIRISLIIIFSFMILFYIYEIISILKKKYKRSC